tara:strand:+ start:42 stop:458 length:417 start_codon:yes stop_codon:yes gene_type:complete
MGTIYRNLAGHADGSSDSVILNTSYVYMHRGGINTSDVNITAFSLANTSESGSFDFDLYLRKVAGYKSNDGSGKAVLVKENNSRKYTTYHIIKGASIPPGSTLFPLDNNNISFDVSYDLVLCIKGTRDMTGDLILTYE